MDPLLIGIIYVFETSSVMMQVTYFKLSGGKRIFRMTPVHHHFELGGFSGKGNPWSEWKVDFFFWGVGLLASLLTLAFFIPTVKLTFDDKIKQDEGIFILFLCV